MKYDNIIVLGYSGVGKSTLINACMEANVAPARFGTEGTTKELKIYESEKLPFRLVDTVGFEPSSISIPFVQSKAIKSVENWIKKNTEAGRDDTKISLIWFCIDGTSGKLFPDVLNSFEKATRIWKTVPIIIVVTKSYSEPDKKKNLDMINAAFARNKSLKERVRAIVPVVAEPFVISEENNTLAPVSGIIELMAKTNELMPEGREASEKDFYEYVLSKLKNQADGVVGLASVFAAVVAGVPILIPDGTILTAIETMEIRTISKIYGIKDDEKSKLFINQIITAGTVGAVAKAILTALKAAPLANIGAIILNIVVATSITATIGELSIMAFEQIYKGEKSIEDIDWIKKLSEDINTNELLEKLNTITEKINDIKDPKEIANIICNLLINKK